MPLSKFASNKREKIGWHWPTYFVFASGNKKGQHLLTFSLSIQTKH
jgi:hypothetical protein